ncbi:MAG: methyltransferase [Candidatus Aminicenantes bacterium RBG_13_62_12]|nr:MAG: methyltransferase [Candidatus Aminicenantes bacterium RBG_13_62_12]
MTSKERVLASLNHREPDAVPVDFGSTAVTGIHVNALAGLRDRYGLEKLPVKVYEPYQMLGFVEEDLKKVMGIDVEGIPAPETLFGFRNEDWKTYRLDSGLEVLVSAHFRTTKAPNGDTLIYPKGDLSAPPSGRMPRNGFFFDTIVRQDPIDDARLNPEDNLEEFGPISPRDLDYFAAEAGRAGTTGRAVMATFGGTAFGDIALVPAPFLKHPKGIRDIEEWYVSTVTRQDYIHRIFSRQAEVALQNLEKIRTVVGDRVDAVFVCGTDLGTQQSQFCSVDAFRKLYFPYYKMVNDWVHRKTNWKTFKHSCGAVEPLIESFIEAGFDILNPVQVTAAGMEASNLKKKYGGRIVFWGGGVDTQTTFAFGTPDEVRDQVLRRMEVLAPGGGFIFNAVHNIQATTPIANIVAMIDAVKEFNGRK